MDSLFFLFGQNLDVNFETFQLAKDPKAFMEKMKAIWKHLSEDEPENQKPPENIEQLIEMLTRESARRFVHFTNFVATKIHEVPAFTGRAFHFVNQEAAILADKLLKVTYIYLVKVYILNLTALL